MERFLLYPVDGLGFWELTETQVKAWEALPVYRGLDVRGEMYKAYAWLDANPSRRKTSRGMKKFLVGWLNRAVDDPRRAKPQQVRDYVWPCPHGLYHSQTVCRTQQILERGRT